MAYINTAYINNGTLLAQAHKVAAAARLVATYDGSSIVTFDLNVAGTSGTYNNIITDTYGRVISGSIVSYLTANQMITVSGDATGSGTTAIALTLAAVGSAGTYTKVVTNAKGLVISGGALQSTDITTALGYTPISTAVEGANNGVATLNSSGQLTASQIPSSLTGGLSYQGTWNAATNTPALASGVGTSGYFYKVATAGTTTLDTISSWNVGDSAIFEVPSGGTIGTWGKIDGIANEVLSVAGMTGVVTLTVANVTGAAPLASPAFTGTPTSTGSLLLTDNSTSLATTSFVKGQAYLTANQTITISGDATGTGTTAITLTLAAVGTAGVYTSVTTDSKGRVISGANLTATGDVTGTASGASIALTLAASGVTAGTYTKLTVNAKGLVTAATLLTSGDVTTALGFTPANIASPTFTGIPAAATAAYGTNTTQLATTAFVERAQGNMGATIFIAGAANTLVAAQTGAMVEATGTIATAVSIPSAVGLPGQMFSFWNNSTGIVSATSAGGIIGGPHGSGTSLIAIPVGATVDIESDGTNWAASGFAYLNNLGPWLALTGGTLTGALVATSGSFTTLTASSTVSGAGFTTLLAPYAPLASAALTGTPTAPTAAYGTSTTQLATTAFVENAQGNSNPTLFITGATNTLTATQTGSMIEATGSIAPATAVVTAVGISGQSFTIFNNSTGVLSATSQGGIFSGPGGSQASLISVPVGATVSIKSDGTNWVTTGFAYSGNIGPWLQLSGGAVTGTVSFASTVTAPTVVLTDSSTNVATTSFVKGQAYLTANQTITISGDATGSGTTAITLTLATVATPGTYSSVVVNAKGLVTSGSINSAWTRVAVTTATSTIAATSANYVGVNYAGVVTLTLATGSVEGRILYIKDESGNAYTNNITVNATTPDTIDGATNTILNVNYEGAALIYSGSAWRQM